MLAGLLEWTPLRQQMWFTKIPPSLQIQLKPPCPAVARACAAWLPKNCVTKAGTDWSAGMDAAAPTDVVYQDSTVAADPGLLEWTPLRQQMWFTKIPPSLQIQLKPPCPAVARACAAWLPKNCVTKAGTDWSAGMDAAAPTDVVYQDSTVAADPGLLEWTTQMWFTEIPPSLQSEPGLLEWTTQMWFTEIPPSLQSEPGLLEWTTQMWFTEIPPSLQSEPGLLEWTTQMWFTEIPPSLQSEPGLLEWTTPDVVYRDPTVAAERQVRYAGLLEWTTQMWFTEIPPSLQSEPGLLEWTPLRQQMWFTKIPPSLQSQMWFTKIPPSLQSQSQVRLRGFVESGAWS
ncbi:hypothetical protein PLESTM_000229100 [Pleodorina starrii]|nr:hypothetical protein PLESTM_000229100 [Pleodorina starrii]